MLTLLFDKQFWISLLICIAIAGVVILFALKPKSRPYIITALCGVLMITSAVSLVNLNRYYSAQGGIKGVISSVINGENKGEIEGNKVTLNKVMLTLDEDGNYSATIIPQNTLLIDKNKTYGVFVNNLPCGYVETSPDYIFAKYDYNFYDKDQNYQNDALEIYFTMDKQTKVEVLTRGGEQMAKHWNYYFNRNDFVITLEEVNGNFSYKEPSSTSSTDSTLVDEIIQKNNLTLLKTFNATFDKDNQSAMVFDTQSNVANLASILDLVSAENSTNFSLITRNNGEVKTWNCANFEKRSLTGQYFQSSNTGGGASTGVAKYPTFTYYRYEMAFGTEAEYFSLIIDYNPEFNANEWEPYRPGGTATPLSAEISTYASSGYEDCNYYFIEHIAENFFNFFDFSIIGDFSFYLTQGTI